MFTIYTNVMYDELYRWVKNKWICVKERGSKELHLIGQPKYSVDWMISLMVRAVWVEMQKGVWSLTSCEETLNKTRMRSGASIAYYWEENDLTESQYYCDWGDQWRDI